MDSNVFAMLLSSGWFLLKQSIESPVTTDLILMKKLLLCCGGVKHLYINKYSSWLIMVSTDFGSDQPCVPAWRCCLMIVTAGSSWHRQRDDLAPHPTAKRWSSRNAPARTASLHGTAATLKWHIYCFRGRHPLISLLLHVTCCTILLYTTWKLSQAILNCIALSK